MRKLKKNSTQLQLKSLPNLTVSTFPTIGVEKVNCTYDSLPLTITEVGSSLSPMWPQYFDAAATIWFVVDCSSMSRLSSAKVELCNLFNSLMQGKSKDARPVAVILNKVDLSSAAQVKAIGRHLRLATLGEEFAKFAKRPVDDMAKVFEISAFTGFNVEKVLEWVRRKGGG
jgi:GTPase SAR1 family protein